MVNFPCIGICKLKENGKLCIGCGRSTEEITYWNNLSNKKNKILKNIKIKLVLKNL